MLSRKHKKLEVFKTLAENLSSLSVCKRKQVGCLILPKDYSQVVAIGYNGPPSGFGDEYCTGVKGQCGCVHAEANALIKCTSLQSDLILICTLSPCAMCASLIINSQRITEIYFTVAHSNQAGVELLRKANLNVNHI